MDSKTCRPCYNEISQLYNIENEINQSSVYFYKTVSEVVNRGSFFHEFSKNEDNSQFCIKSVQKEWSKIEKLHSCSAIHLGNVTKYHQFSHEVKTLKNGMFEALKWAENLIPLDLSYIGDSQFINTIDQSLKDLLFTYQYWVGKLYAIAEKSKSIVNPSERLERVQMLKPITALCDFETKIHNVTKNEDLVLIDNEDPLIWKVSDLARTCEFHLPSVVCHITAPHSGAIAMANELLIVFLKGWTLNMKLLGKNMILYLIYIVWNFTEEEIEAMKLLSRDKKVIIINILDAVVKDLFPVWSGFKGYELLVEQVELFKKSLLLESGSELNDSTVVSIDWRFAKLRDVMDKFQNIWKLWSNYHSVVNFSLDFDYLLSINKWSEFDIIKKDDLKTNWQKELEFNDAEEEHIDSWMTILREKFTLVKCEHEKRRKELEAEELMHSEAEEKKVFTITGVYNARTGKEISLKEAISLRIIDQNNGMYVNKVDFTSMPIPEAMNKGLIKSELTIVRKTKEKKSDMGLVTIRTKLESKPYNVLSVIDAKTGHHLSVDEALEAGIFDLKRAIYFNRKTLRSMTLSDAFDANLIEVEFDHEAGLKEPQLATHVYAISSVRDQMKKEDVGFSIAVQRGILDQNTGTYYNNITGEAVYISHAIRKGLIHAKKVDNNTELSRFQK